MTDPFSLLQLDRRPLLDAATITTSFQNLAAAAHPDSTDGDTAHFAALNSARNTLINPALRLRTLVALESGIPHSTDRRPVPDALSDVFAEISGTLSVFDDFLKRKHTAPGALAKAMLATEEIAIQEQLQTSLATLEHIESQLDQALAYADEQWQTASRAALLHELEELADAFSYLQRWKSQVQEKFLLLIT